LRTKRETLSQNKGSRVWIEKRHFYAKNPISKSRHTHNFYKMTSYKGKQTSKNSDETYDSQKGALPKLHASGRNFPVWLNLFHAKAQSEGCERVFEDGYLRPSNPIKQANNGDRPARPVCTVIEPPAQGDRATWFGKSSFQLANQSYEDQTRKAQATFNIDVKQYELDLRDYDRYEAAIKEDSKMRGKALMIIRSSLPIHMLNSSANITEPIDLLDDIKRQLSGTSKLIHSDITSKLEEFRMHKGEFMQQYINRERTLTNTAIEAGLEAASNESSRMLRLQKGLDSRYEPAQFVLAVLPPTSLAKFTEDLLKMGEVAEHNDKRQFIKKGEKRPNDKVLKSQGNVKRGKTTNMRSNPGRFCIYCGHKHIPNCNWKTCKCHDCAGRKKTDQANIANAGPPRIIEENSNDETADYNHELD
jgi:hypothetical protein